MQNISSQLTLILKLVFPVFWTVFFSTISLYFLLSDDASFITKVVVLSLFFLGIVPYYFLFFKLKRVEMDDQFVYVGNYRQMRRYPFSNIEKITEKRPLLIRQVAIDFVEPGFFGKRIIFMPNGQYKILMKDNEAFESVRN